MNRIRLAVFSLTGNAPSGDDASYLEWHALDHMPEQYSLPGVAKAQRWKSTPACRQQRAAEHESVAAVENVVSYLMGEPAVATLEEFMALGKTLADLGRFPEAIPSRFLGGFELLGAHASPRVLVSDEVVPWRPNLGLYLLIERIVDRAGAGAFLQRVHAEHIPSLLEVPGVAGVWWFGTTPRYRHPTFSVGNFRVTACYLDGPPVEVAASLAPLLEQRWQDRSIEPWLAAPFESVVVWDWRRFLDEG